MVHGASEKRAPPERWGAARTSGGLVGKKVLAKRKIAARIKVRTRAGLNRALKAEMSRICLASIGAWPSSAWTCASAQLSFQLPNPLPIIRHGQAVAGFFKFKFQAFDLDPHLIS